MRHETVTKCANKLDRKQALTDLLNAAEGLPRHQRVVFMAGIMKEVVAGRISAAEEKVITKAVKV
jgi:hypothetical protein